MWVSATVRNAGAKGSKGVVEQRTFTMGFPFLVVLFQQIIAGDSHVVLAGGTENMSQAPFAVRNTRFGVPLGAKIEVAVLSVTRR